MALPFLAGLAVGAAAIIAYNNKDKITSSAKKGLKGGKELFDEVKEYAISEGTKLKKASREKLESLKQERKPKAKPGRKPRATTATKTAVKKPRTRKPRAVQTAQADGQIDG